MGTLIAPKDEMPERKQQAAADLSAENPGSASQWLETRTGIVEHNGRMGFDAGKPHLVRPSVREPKADMANELLTIPESESQAAAAYLAKHEFDGFLGKSFEEKPIWTGLY